MQEQKEGGDSVVHTVTTGQTGRPQDHKERQSATSTGTSSRSIGGSLINRRELVDVFSEWLVQTYSGVNPLPVPFNNYEVVLREAMRRHMDVEAFVKAILDDVLSAYAEETDKAIEMAYREEPL